MEGDIFSLLMLFPLPGLKPPPARASPRGAGAPLTSCQSQDSFSYRAERLKPSTRKPPGTTAGILQRVKRGVNAPADLWEAADGLLALEV